MDRGSKKRAVILLVEDDPGDQELTRRALDADAIKTRLFVVSNGEDAMDFLRQRNRFSPQNAPRPDLVLLNLNVPKLDGRQVLSSMREDHVLRSIPVIVLTASRQEEDILRSYELECSAFIAKPLAVETFIQAVRQLDR